MKLCKISTFATLLAFGYSVHVIAQTNPSALPQDPLALMNIAHDKNGLVGADVKPWHMRGTYRSFETNGRLKYEGTYEEWWVSATKYKLSFTNPKYTQTDYANGSILLRDGSQEWLTGLEVLMRASVIQPLPDASQLGEFKLERSSRGVGDAYLQCVGLTYPLRPNLKVTGTFYPTACFEPRLPLLRTYSEGSLTLVSNDDVVFQGHYVPRQIQALVNGKLAAELKLDVVENLSDPPNLSFDAPTSALPVDLTKIQFALGAGSRWPVLLRRDVPDYPQIARHSHVQGIVKIRATIGLDGHVESPKVLSGPGMLRDPALDAVRQFVYEPFNVMGQTKPVEIEVQIVFQLE